jgi:8-oxo-dGTP diphosphatase
MRIHVVAGVLEDSVGRILLAQRPPGKHLEGQWEFPGGKLGDGEDRLSALARELDEELGLSLESARPLIRYVHRYPEFSVDLDIWRVTAWRGEPNGREGQALQWVAPESLLNAELVAADAPIVAAIRLPEVVAITPPQAADGEEVFLDALEDTVAAGVVRLIVLRRPDLGPKELLELATGAACRLEGGGSRLMLHGDADVLGPLIAQVPAELAPRLETVVAGLHAPARSLTRLSERPVPKQMWFGVSCHSQEELEAALALGADYAFLGTVKPTASHPGEEGLGWERFAMAVEGLALPVYAIGGMTPDDLPDAWAAGAQGIAAIRSLWGGAS